MVILASKWGKMAYHFRYNVNKALNMIQRMFCLYLPDISSIILGLVRKRTCRNWVRTINYFKLPSRTYTEKGLLAWVFPLPGKTPWTILWTQPSLSSIPLATFQLLPFPQVEAPVMPLSGKKSKQNILKL